MRKIFIEKKITNRTAGLERYFQDIRNKELISAEEEHELFVRYKNGDESAREKIIESNLRFVISVAKKYEGKNCNLEDLISEGNKGLVEAIENFDPDKGFKFISYGVWHIRKYMQMYVRDLSNTVRIPVSVDIDLNKYKKIESLIAKETGKIPTLEEVLSYIKENNIDHKFSSVSMRAIKNNPTSIPLDPIRSGGEESEYHPIDWIEDSPSDQKNLELKEKNDLLMWAISKIPKLEREVIYMKYGIIDGVPMENDEIAKRIGKSRETARLKGKKGEERIRKILKNRMDDLY